MRFTVSTIRRAEADITSAHAWIAERSTAVQHRWYEAAREAIRSLSRDADQHGLAQEGSEFGIELPEKIFKTRRGRPYRVLYTLDGKEVRVLRLRGPGQAPVTPEDLSE